MTDGKQAFLDAKLFLRKLKRYLAKQIDCTVSQKSFQYITIAEPQGENHGNSWHLHILLIFADTAPFIENDTIAELWSHGITSTHKVFDGDGLALYFKVYLSDIEYEDANADVEDNTDKPATVRAYYEKRKAEGKTSQQALICISRRLISIIYGMLKNGTEYRMPVVENAGENV